MNNTLIKKTINNDQSLFIQAQSGDEKAREQLFLQNRRMCNVIAYKYYGCDEFEDLLSVAYIGLIKAIDNYDVSKNYHFSSFAYKCIGNEILMHLRKLNKLKLKDIRSLNDPVSTSKNDGANDISLQDIIPEKESFDEIVYQRERQLRVKQILCQLKENVPPKQYEMLLDFYGLQGRTRLNQTQLAVKYKLSRPYISRMLDSSRKMMKQYLEDMNLRKENLL